MKKLRMHTMLGTNHSWAVVMRNLAISFAEMGNEIFLRTTNGMDSVDPALYDFFHREVAPYDIDMSYTLPRNFRRRFLSDSKVKLGIYNYETDVVPSEWASACDHIDYLLPSSNFSRDIFLKNGFPEQKCVVVPHGIRLSDFENKDSYNLSTKKGFKFLNISIPHYRKNIDILINAYYDSFSDNDDVCLVLKTKLVKPKLSFEVDVRRIISRAQRKFLGKKLPQVEVLTKNIENMVPLYNSVDAVVSASSSEGFGLPMLEAIAAGKVVIAPNATGHTDFLNSENSILYESNQVVAPRSYQYWRPSSDAKTYMPNIDCLSQSMLDLYANHQRYLDRLSHNMRKTSKLFTWDSAAAKIMELL